MSIRTFIMKTQYTNFDEIPFEGIFWVIDNFWIVGVADQFDLTNKLCGKLDHEDAWDYFKNLFKVHGKPVPYDYFPRGRVVVSSIERDDGENKFDIRIYCDGCILNHKYALFDYIADAFHINNNKCRLKNVGNEKYYECNRCKGD